MEQGFNELSIKEYNERVIEKLKEVSERLKIPFEKFSPKDKDGIEHTLGLFENDGNYEQFITQGAKKYAVTKWIPLKKIKDKSKVNILKEENDRALILEITVSGVPKSGALALKSLEEFNDHFVFDFKYTNKNILMYNDFMQKTILSDYLGNKLLVDDIYGCCLLPTTYELGKSEEYANLLSELSSARNYFEE